MPAGVEPCRRLSGLVLEDGRAAFVGALPPGVLVDSPRVKGPVVTPAGGGRPPVVEAVWSPEGSAGGCRGGLASAAGGLQSSAGGASARWAVQIKTKIE